MKNTVVVPFVLLLVLCAAGMPECSQGVQPLATAENKKADDAFPGSYVQQKKDGTAPTAEEKKKQQQFLVEKADNGDYTVTTWAADKPKDKEKYRVAIVDLGGKRVLDATIDPSVLPKQGREQMVPVHYYLKMETVEKGYALFHLDEAWLDAQNAKAAIPTIQLTSIGNDKDDFFSGDVVGLLNKALADNAAWAPMSEYHRVTKKTK